MSSKKDVKRQFDQLETLPLGKELKRKRNALLRKIKAQIKDEERASKKYFELQTEARLIDKEIANDLYKISGEEFVHKTKLEGMYKKLGGELR